MGTAAVGTVAVGTVAVGTVMVAMGTEALGMVAGDVDVGTEGGIGGGTAFRVGVFVVFCRFDGGGDDGGDGVGDGVMPVTADEVFGNGEHNGRFVEA